MVQVVATRKIPYGRKYILAGESFDATEKDAKLFLKVGWATADRPASLEVPQGLQTMAAPAVAERVEEAAPEAPAHPQAYLRRDMTAEPVGQTGAAELSQSSPPGRPRRPKA